MFPSVEDAVEKAKALQLQVTTATFQKLESDLEGDVAAIKAWAEKEKSRKSSWQSVVLTHKRKRYVRGLATVKKLSEDELAYAKVESGACHMELAGFRAKLDHVIPTHAEKRLVGIDCGHPLCENHYSTIFHRGALLNLLAHH